MRYLGSGSKKSYKDRGYTVKEIKLMLEYAPDVRAKSYWCYCLRLQASGWEQSPDLKLEHFKKIKMENSSLTLYRVTVYDNSDEEYYTFTTPKSAAVIDEYISSREKGGEKINANSPFLRDRFNIKNIVSSNTRGISSHLRLVAYQSNLSYTHASRTGRITFFLFCIRFHFVKI